MIERVLKQEQAIARVLVSDRKHQHLIPTWQDKEVLNSVQAALKPVADFTDLLSFESYVTFSSVKPVLQLLTGDLLGPNPSDTDLTQRIKRKICNVLEDKYSAQALKELLAKSSILDPRYRGNGEDDLEEIKEELFLEMVATGESGAQVSAASATATGASDEDESSATGECTPPSVKKRNIGDLLKWKGQQTQGPAPIPIRVRADTELTRYLQEEQLDSSDDPLAWWRDNCGRFPRMEKVVRHYMCI
ncbi:hypothetical protein SKAU_G00063040 [Synaphobranchus kaupii]|uniref:HAT C-terminal dimerisation domain-containing protein n=1 Tax=Synaphobranchus kaupii TaxID=118154 RepID=A0A9Q1G590_SYNKA|nr:hypothetical protein SKAU_G00063040 [Synaphobranchus kaupii]